MKFRMSRAWSLQMTSKSQLKENVEIIRCLTERSKILGVDEPGVAVLHRIKGPDLVNLVSIVIIRFFK